MSDLGEYREKPGEYRKTPGEYKELPEEYREKPKEYRENPGEYKEKPLPSRNSCEMSITPDSPKPRARIVPQKVKKHASEVALRLNQYKEKAKTKLEHQRLAKEKVELADCSFAPKLTSKQYKTPNRVPIGSYVQTAIAHSPPTKSTLKAAIPDSPPATFRPTLDSHSLELTRSRDPAKVFTALYTTTCATLTAPPESPSFRPLINLKSVSLMRSQPVAELLYQDACRRKEKQGGKRPVRGGLETNQMSEEIMRKRFKREFYAALMELFEEKREDLTVSEVCRLLVRLRFIEGKSQEGKTIFEFLTKSQRLEVNTLYACLCEILGLTLHSFQHPAGDVRSLFRKLYVNRLRLPPSSKPIPRDDPVPTGTRTEDYIYRQKMLKLLLKSALISPLSKDPKAALNLAALI